MKMWPESTIKAMHGVYGIPSDIASASPDGLAWPIRLVTEAVVGQDTYCLARYMATYTQCGPKYPIYAHLPMKDRRILSDSMQNIEAQALAHQNDPTGFIASVGGKYAKDKSIKHKPAVVQASS